jgi:NAD(P)-dependent dehydrogenase (short-subunit alcohol dehydrogenase family)
VLGPRLWPLALARLEGIDTDLHPPSPTLAGDAARGLALYRANFTDRLRRPRPRTTAVPVQVLLVGGDRFVTPGLLEGIEETAPDLWRRTVVDGHWIPLTAPEAVARWIAEFVELVDHPAGPAPRALARSRVAPGVPRDRFEGSLVLVTGAGSGIGRATALAFAELGAAVVAVDIDGESARRTAELARLLGAEAHHRVTDVADRSAVAGLAKVLAAGLGVPDVVVNNAGIALAGPMLETSGEDWEAILAVNLGGVIAGSREFGRLLAERREGGHIVNVASAAAFTPSRTFPAYATTKAAVLMLTEPLRAELAGSGVGVSAVCPGFTRTPIVTATRYLGVDRAEEDRPRGAAERLYRRRSLRPERVAAAIVGAVAADRAR